MKKFTLFAAAAIAALTFPASCTKEPLSTETISENNFTIEAGDRAAAPNLNGQSVQVNFDFDGGSFQITEEGTWSYDYNAKPVAVAAFDTYFTYTTSGSPNAGQIENAKHQAFLDNKCMFYHGDPLTVSVTTNGSRSVTCTPKSPGQYPAGTGWTFQGQLNSVDVNLSNIYVASVSWLGKSKKQGGWQYKYSYTMTDTAGSRLLGLTVEMLRETPTGDVLVGSYTPAHTVGTGLDWLYTSLGTYYGDSGAAAALAFAESQNVNITQGTNTYDDFSGNNGTGGQRANVPNQAFVGISLDGNYKVRISGVIKGNGFVANQPFTITRTVVTTGGCN